MAKPKKRKGGKKRRSKGTSPGHDLARALGATGKKGGRRHGRRPSKKALNAYYANVRKAYRKLKPIAEKHGFA